METGVIHDTKLPSSMGNMELHKDGQLMKGVWIVSWLLVPKIDMYDFNSFVFHYVFVYESTDFSPKTFKTIMNLCEFIFLTPMKFVQLKDLT
jgi:hypothetical protein